MYFSSSDTGASKIPTFHGCNASDSFFWVGFSSSDTFFTLLKLYIVAIRIKKSVIVTGVIDVKLFYKLFQNFDF